MKLEFRKEDWEEFLGNIDFTERNAQCVSLIETAHGAERRIAAYGLCVLFVYTQRKTGGQKVWV